MSEMNLRFVGLRGSMAIIGLSVCGWMTGCSSTDSDRPGVASTQSAANNAADSAATQADPPVTQTGGFDTSAATDEPKNNTKMTPVDLAGYRAAIDRHQGEAVLVDFWASWCNPCKRMFPHTLHLAEKYRGKGLAVMSFSLDDSEQRPEALQFLRSQEGEVENLVANFPEGSDPFEVLDITGGTIPHFKLYDRNGKLHQKFFFDDAGSSFTPESIDAAVAELLDAQK